MSLDVGEAQLACGGGLRICVDLYFTSLYLFSCALLSRFVCQYSYFFPNLFFDIVSVLFVIIVFNDLWSSLATIRGILRVHWIGERVLVS